MKNDNFTIEAMNERPTMAILNLNGKGKVDFQIEGGWVRNPSFNILVPYPTSPKEAMYYIANFINGIVIVPYDNIAQNEEFVEEAKDELDKFSKLIIEGKHSSYVVSTDALFISLDLVVTP